MRHRSNWRGVLRLLDDGLLLALWPRRLAGNLHALAKHPDALRIWNVEAALVGADRGYPLSHFLDCIASSRHHISELVVLVIQRGKRDPRPFLDALPRFRTPCVIQQRLIAARLRNRPSEPLAQIFTVGQSELVATDCC